MPKAEKGTPKALANAMKWKGLQKLKFFCQMCGKQMKDKDGFKAHCRTEGHLRNMRLFGENSNSVIHNYSLEFEKCFLDLMRRKYFSKFVSMNKIYMDYISNKLHTHMNATKWTTLTGFAQYLASTGKVLLEDGPRGPMVKYIDKSPEALQRQKEKEKKILMDQKAEQKSVDFIQKQMEIAYKIESEKNQINEDEDKQEEQGQVEEEKDSINQNDAQNDFDETESQDQLDNQDEDENHKQEEEESQQKNQQIDKESQSKNQPQSILSFEFKKPLQQKQLEFTEVTNLNPSNNQKISFSFNLKRKQNFDDEDTTNNQVFLNQTQLQKSDSSQIREIQQNLLKNDDSHQDNNSIQKTKHQSGLDYIMQNKFNQQKKLHKNEEIKSVMIDANSMGLTNLQSENNNNVFSEDAWVTDGIIVKIKDKDFAGGKYFGKKGLIKAVHNEYLAEILIGKETLKIDQIFLQTVIPKIGGVVMILKRGKYHQKFGILESIHPDNHSGSVKLIDVDVTLELKYHEFSKIKENIVL